MKMNRTTSARVVVTGAVAALAAAVAVPALTTAQTTGTRDITVREKLRGVQIVDAAPNGHGRKLSRGDRVITQQALFDTSDRPIGSLYTDCVGVGATAALDKATLYCTSTYRLPDGDVMAAAVVRFSERTTGAITGGTGAYRNAGGQGESGAPPKGYDGLDVIHVEG